jgi:acetoin utilization deacetylase AcuC-like enzyme
MVLDWDVHHGNGTQDIFYEDPSVLLVDLHEESATYPSPPYAAGGAEDMGAGAGAGFTINVPLPSERPTGSAYLLPALPRSSPRDRGGGCSRIARSAVPPAAPVGRPAPPLLPLGAGHTGGAGALRAFHAVVRPAALRFAPDIILCSAGYDSHAADPSAWQRHTTPKL